MKFKAMNVNGFPINLEFVAEIFTKELKPAEWKIIDENTIVVNTILDSIELKANNNYLTVKTSLPKEKIKSILAKASYMIVNETAP